MNALQAQTVLVFVPMHDSEGKKDVSGAFLPEAQTFVKLAQPGSRIHRFDNHQPLPARAQQVLAELVRAAANQERYSSVAFFCHGWMDGIQAGFVRASAAALAKAIRSVCAGSSDVVIPLYCCSTGSDPQNDPLTAAGTGDDSFADKLRDALCVEGAIDCRVVGHTTVAHTTMNPMVLFMDGMGVPGGGVGGYPPVSPKSANWDAWKAALHNTNLRFRMPYMPAAAIHAELTQNV